MDIGWININDITKVEDAKKSLAMLIRRDHQLDVELKQYIQMRDDIERQMDTFDTDIPDYLHLLLSKSGQLTKQISSTCSLAELLSSKVKNLDRIRERLRDTLKKVDDIIDLKNCIEGVQRSLGIEDYEAAANHVHRYLNIDQSVLEQSSIEMLNDAQTKLLSMIQQRYDQALTAHNQADVLRFCKIFIQLHREEEGLEKYCAFLRIEASTTLDPLIDQRKQQQQPPAQQQTPKQQPISSSQIITKVFQFYASLIEDHLEIVKNEFGIAMCPLFLMSITKQADFYSARVFSTFTDQFNIVRSVSDVVAIKDHHSSSSTSSGRIDPRAFAQVLDEIVAMSKATKFYEKYLLTKEKILKAEIKQTIDTLIDEENSIGSIITTDSHHDVKEQQQQQSIQQTSNDSNSSNNKDRIKLSSIEQLQKINIKTTMYSTDTKQKMNELLGNYLLLEEYFMVESSHKAIQLDEHSEDSLTSSMVDYIFFVLQKSLQRSIDSYSIQTLNVISNRLIRILIQTQGTLQKMFREQIMKATIKSNNNIEYRESMIVLNNIETSSEYILKLKKEMELRCLKVFVLPEEKDQVELQSTEFSNVAKSYSRLLNEELEQIFKSIQPKLKNALILNTGINYEIGQEEYDNNDVNDPFVYPFTTEITQFLKPFEDHLTQTNYDHFVHLTIGFLLKKIEASVFTKRFTLLGSLQFGKDIRAVSNFFTKICRSTIRDKFSKLNQIISFLTLEKLGEVEEFWSENSSMSSWKLSPTEVKKILSVRIDFNPEAISRIKL
ncbi:oligomeric Golgi complex component [Heterostelium album PN500]|uniref:Conserved oligomeric Golgi complex subunit 4 n=1 Tax=Heterostelium pallidum (strain ATCC 26659 / Pp 5 / PN500) TaxID=670386 RepID=D3B806_HETP5|nr:oligomeric Golgi complex component [Heterostelium album PN500]EFA82174.1 oligomeric Golgi complex component [Heterostelium album PN500]|eukprot:XP_020434291.1 oligomeric Golgi complex component [Heterostelium album PN500]